MHEYSGKLRYAVALFSIQPPSTSEAVCTSLDISEKETIESPADIYTKFSSCFAPRSILKAKTEPKKEKRKKTRERKVAFESDIDSQVEADTKQVSIALAKRFILAHLIL